MRTEYMIIGILTVLIASLALLLAAIVYLLAPEETTTTTLTTTKLGTIPSLGISSLRSSTTRLGTTPSSGISSLRSSTTTTRELGTTTTTTQKPVEPKQLTIELPKGQTYKYDDVEVRILAEGKPVQDALITVDDIEEYTTDSDGIAVIHKIDSGEHDIKATREGYVPANTTIDVHPVSYANSPAVKIQHTPEERNSFINQGKTVLIFYDRPNCPNCMAMKPWVADIVNENRECIMYELLKIIYREPREEVKELFPDQSRISTPVIVIQGPNGRHVTTGFQSKTTIKGMTTNVADERCIIR